MSLRPCQQETEILAAARSGGLDSGQRGHVAGCAHCSLALEAEAAMSEAAVELARGARLAPPDVVLLRAKLRARREVAERSLRPLELWQRFAALAVAAGLTVALALSGTFFGGLASPAELGSPSRALFVLALAGLAVLPFVRRLRAAV